MSQAFWTLCTKADDMPPGVELGRQSEHREPLSSIKVLVAELCEAKLFQEYATWELILCGAEPELLEQDLYRDALWQNVLCNKCMTTASIDSIAVWR